MKKTFIERKFTLTPDITAAIEKKLSRLEKFFDASTEIVITLSSERNNEKIELTIFENGIFYRSEETDEKMLCALDRAIDIIERQIRKNKTKLQRRIKKDIPSLPQFDDVDYEEDEIKISKVKHFSIKPMSAEEAVLQMNMLGHEFFVFKDMDSNNTCVVYKRHGNTYGLIVPTDE
jgi:putative sigma-54 modulation protein